MFKALAFSPLIGFALSFLLLLAMKFVVRSKALYTAPEGKKPPPAAIRALLVLTCTGVSFFHGSNDGQKGMGLIMLILIGVAPTAYALNRAMPESATPAFAVAVSASGRSRLRRSRDGNPADQHGARGADRRAQAAQGRQRIDLLGDGWRHQRYCRRRQALRYIEPCAGGGGAEHSQRDVHGFRSHSRAAESRRRVHPWRKRPPFTSYKKRHSTARPGSFRPG